MSKDWFGQNWSNRAHFLYLCQMDLDFITFSKSAGWIWRLYKMGTLCLWLCMYLDFTHLPCKSIDSYLSICKSRRFLSVFGPWISRLSLLYATAIHNYYHIFKGSFHFFNQMTQLYYQKVFSLWSFRTNKSLWKTWFTLVDRKRPS